MKRLVMGLRAGDTTFESRVELCLGLATPWVLIEVRLENIYENLQQGTP